MTDVQLTYSDVEDELRDTVRRLLADREDLPGLVASMEREVPHDAHTWKSLDGGMGIGLLLVPEALGGASAGAREVGVVMEEIGRHLAPVPYLGHAALAAGVVVTIGSVEVARRFATTTPTSVVVPFHRSWRAAFPDDVRWDGKHLDGTVDLVVDAGVATTLLVPAVSADGPVIVSCAATAAAATRIPGFDLTRDLATVVFDQVAGEVIASGEQAVSALAAGTRQATAALACEQVGVAERALDLAVEHAKARIQFGRAIGSFQAVKHHLAETWVAVTQARAAVRYAVDALDRNDDVETALSVAAVVANQTAVLAAETCLQVHGGLGFSWEHPSHLFLKRARSNAQAFGGTEQHLDLMADLADLPAPVAVGPTCEESR